MQSADGAKKFFVGIVFSNVSMDVLSLMCVCVVFDTISKEW